MNDKHICHYIDKLLQAKRVQICLVIGQQSSKLVDSFATEKDSYFSTELAFFYWLQKTVEQYQTKLNVLVNTQDVLLCYDNTEDNSKRVVFHPSFTKSGKLIIKRLNLTDNQIPEDQTVFGVFSKTRYNNPDHKISIFRGSVLLTGPDFHAPFIKKENNFIWVDHD